MKRFIISLIVLTCSLGITSACLADASVDSHDIPVFLMDRQYKEYHTPLGKICIVTDFNRVLVKNAELYPALAKSLEVLHNQVWKEKLEADANDSMPYAIEFKKNRSEEYRYFLLEERLRQVYAGRNVVSFAGEFYQNLGGARPLIECCSYNFNPLTGRLYVLDDILKPGKRDCFLQQAVKPELDRINTTERRCFYDNYPTIVDTLFAKDARGEQFLNWTWNGKGVSLYFNPDVLAPGVAGIVEVTVPAERFEQMFQEQFLKGPLR